MSNPAVYELAKATVKNYRIRIEDNLGESIHVHIGDFRISMTVSEFSDLVEQFQKAADELLGLQGLSLDIFDRTSFDWSWMHKYEKIKKIEKINVKIKDLLTMGESEVFPDLQIIVPVSKSRQYKALNKEYDELIRYKEVNEYGVSNIERLEKVLDCIREHGYPYDNKYILVNQFNQIYDGDHRAACLLYLHGGDAIVPVIKMVLEDETSIEEQKRMEKEMLQKFIEKRMKIIPSVHKWTENLNFLNCDFDDFLKRISKCGFDYFIVPHQWSFCNGEMVADKCIVIEEGTMIDFCKKMNISYYGKCCYRYYSFLYSMQRCVYLETIDSKVLIFDRLSCKSKFEDAIMPLDKRIQLYGWRNAENHEADMRIRMIYVIVDSLLNGNGFSADARKFIENRCEMLNDEVLISLLEMIFFKYTDKLVKYMEECRYNLAYMEYFCNKTY